MDLGRSLIVMSVCMMAFNNIATLAPCLKVVIEGCVAAGAVMRTINNPNEIVSGNHQADIQGVVQRTDVDFTYPSAPQKPILRKVNLSIVPGDTLAILGNGVRQKHNCELTDEVL